MLHPVGPLPVATYWVRRGMVLAGILFLLIIFGVLVGAAGGGSKAPTKTVGTGISLPTPALSTTGPTGSAVPKHSASAAATTSAACADADLSVTIATGSASYPSGSLPQFVVTVTNSGAAACTRDVGAKSAVITVVSGSDRIWSSGDCPSVKADVRTLAPGVAVKLPSSWDRDRSVPGCTTTGAAGQPAKTGVYVASVALGTLKAPGTASFHLS